MTTKDKNIFTLKALKKELEKHGSGYIYEELSSWFIGKEEVLWLSIEDTKATKETVFAYRVLETIAEGATRENPLVSSVGDETYNYFKVDSTEEQVINDTPYLAKFLKGTGKGTFLFIEIRIPGLTDYLLVK
jgi:hypothetical protein